MSGKGKLFLIDGHALIFRMYYAFYGHPMVNSKGVDTSILFGFTKYLLELVEKERPTHLAVSFDPPGGTFRNLMYPAYKANRGETPQLVIDALEPLTRILEAMNIPVLMLKGYEADDVIGSMAKRSAAEGFEVYMVTPDKDYGQLVAPGIFQFRPGRGGGENEVLGEAEICGKWGIDRTSQVIDLLALCGDSSDNVPGVAGIGPVSASKLLLKYGSVDGIYASLKELTASQRAKFEAAADHIGLSRQLVTIKTDIVLETTAESMVFDTVATPELLSVFDEFEFPSLKKKLLSICGGPGTVSSESPGKSPAKPSGSIPEYSEVRADIVRDLSSKEKVLAFGLMDGGRVCLATADKYAVVPLSAAKDMLEDASTVKAGYDLKSSIKTLQEEGVSLLGPLQDILLMHYVLNPEKEHSLEALCGEYFGRRPAKEETIFGESSDDDIVTGVQAVRHLGTLIGEEMDATAGCRKLYETIEEPLIRVLSGMETTGVRIDAESLREFADGLRRSMAEREAMVRELAGEPSLNVSSPRQIGAVIFEKLKLDPAAKKPRSGNWPTDEQTLQELSDRSPIIDAILDYRGLRKLLNTYIEPIPGYMGTDGRVHTTFNQALTSTGRLSSSNPNLQNIPIRTEQGREIRKAFVPGEKGWVIMSADYSQIELRIMAHLCGDDHLISAFNAGTDVHAASAAKIFATDISSVTPDQRRIAKTVNFGIMYGISAFGLSQRLNCSRAEAKAIIDDYFTSFPRIRLFIDRTIESARANGYVETIFGRRRYVPDVSSTNGNIRAVAERNAVNAPIQGSSADIIKLAMVAVDGRLREEGLNAKMVLQIHDELVLEVPENEIDRVRTILKEEMEGVVDLSVPLTVECNYGNTWLEAH